MVNNYVNIFAAKASCFKKILVWRHKIQNIADAGLLHISHALSAMVKTNKTTELIDVVEIWQQLINVLNVSVYYYYYYYYNTVDSSLSATW